MSTNEFGIVVKPNEVTAGHVGIEAQLYYKGSHAEPTLRIGKIERVTDEVITLKFDDGTFKAFRKDKVEYGSVFLFT